jgi:hypothetical protein
VGRTLLSAAVDFDFDFDLDLNLKLQLRLGLNLMLIVDLAVAVASQSPVTRQPVNARYPIAAHAKRAKPQPSQPPARPTSC